MAMRKIELTWSQQVIEDLLVWVDPDNTNTNGNGIVKWPYGKGRSPEICLFTSKSNAANVEVSELPNAQAVPADKYIELEAWVSITLDYSEAVWAMNTIYVKGNVWDILYIIAR